MKKRRDDYDKDQAELTFREISEFDIFASLQFSSLRQLYGNARKAKDGNNNFLTFSSNFDTYRVTLKVTDNDGGSDGSEKPVTITK